MRGPVIYRYLGAFYCHSCMLVVRRSRLASAGIWTQRRKLFKPERLANRSFNRPLHCELCGKFLKNRLTGQGWDYVYDAVGRGWADLNRTQEWNRFYLRGYEPTRYFDSRGVAVVAK